MTDAPDETRKRPLREQLRRAWARLRGGELTPSRAFWSVAIGVFIGVQPTPGLHIFLVLAVCVPLRLDAALSYLAANISIPPIAPLLWFAAIQIGARLVSGHFVPVSVDGARALVHAPGPLLASLVTGSLVLGAGLGALFGGLAFAVARARRRPSAASPFDLAAARTAERFARATRRRATRHYVAAKLRGDPATRAVAGLAPLGEVVDLGCGRGQLAVLLLEVGAAERVRGCDWDEKKLALARAAADGLAADFVRADVRAYEGEPADTVLLVDVLHYFDAATQDALLARAARLIRPGGRLVMREASRGFGARSAITRFFEGIGTAVRVNRGERVVFRDVARELVPMLEALGLECTLTPCWEGTPFANVLLIARRNSQGDGEAGRTNEN